MEKGVYTIIPFGSQFLMLKRRDNRLWEFPGGKIELGETPYQAAKREVLEETGLTVDVRPLWFTKLKYASKKVSVCYYIGLPKNIMDVYNIVTSKEHKSSAWFNIHAMDDLPTVSVRAILPKLHTICNMHVVNRFISYLGYYKVKHVLSAGYTGSLARGDYLPYYSDIDLFVYFNKSIELDKLRKILNNLDYMANCQVSLHIDNVKTENSIQGYLDLLEQKYCRIYLYKQYRHKYNVTESPKLIKEASLKSILRSLMFFRYYYCLIRSKNAELGAIHCDCIRRGKDYHALLLGKLYDIATDIIRYVAMYQSGRFIRNLLDALSVIKYNTAISDIVQDWLTWGYNQQSILISFNCNNYNMFYARLKRLVRFYEHVQTFEARC